MSNNLTLMLNLTMTTKIFMVLFYRLVFTEKILIKTNNNLSIAFLILRRCSQRYSALKSRACVDRLSRSKARLLLIAVLVNLRKTIKLINKILFINSIE